jgi:hypothetical protein
MNCTSLVSVQNMQLFSFIAAVHRQRMTSAIRMPEHLWGKQLQISATGSAHNSHARFDLESPGMI